MRIARLLIGFVALGGTLVSGSAAFAASARTTPGGELHFLEVASAANGTATAIVTGAFADYGVDHAGVADNGAVNEIVLQKGSFEVNDLEAQ